LLLTSFGALAQTLSICTFNTRDFGRTKVKDTDRVNVLAGIVRKYDIVAIQEISDKTCVVPGVFLEKINDNGQYHYEYLCSERTGKQADDAGGAEQYAFYYNAGKVSLAGEPALYDDSRNDRFAREPYTARFKTKKGNFTFVLTTVHTDPDHAVQEIGSLDEVARWAGRKYNNEKDIIVLGDFNASCDYAKPARLDSLDIRKGGYCWIVPDNAKTNISANADCAYDRIVVTPSAKLYYTGEWGVDSCFTNNRISDHWPVWAVFKVKK